jgi:methionyl-tRNA synthetase
VIWPSILLGANGRGASGGSVSDFGELHLPHEVVSSEFLTMEGKKFSSSRNVVIYVRDVLERYGPDPLRYFLSIAGPENQDTDFTWSEFVRRNNEELVAAWGNLVNRTVSMTARNLGAIPAAGELTDGDRAVLAESQAAFGEVGALLEQSRQKAAIGRAMEVVFSANKYLSEHEPWKLKNSDPDRMASVLHVALQLVDDAKTLLTPFLPHASQKVHELLGGTGTWSAMPEIHEVDEEGGAPYPVLTGDHAAAQATWESRPIAVGTELAAPTPLFVKLDPSVIDEELGRLGLEPDE